MKIQKDAFIRAIKNAIIIALISLITGCIAIGNVTLEVDNKIPYKQEIAINVDYKEPWIGEIERRLKKHGFRVLRTSSADKASARYFLRVNAYAPLDFRNRCIFGGFNFDYFYADLIDLQSHEAIASIESRGYSEGCHPFSGTIFENTALMVKNSWD